MNNKYNLYGALACLRKWGFENLKDTNGQVRNTMLWWQNPPANIDKNARVFNPTKGGGIFSSALNKIILTQSDANEVQNDKDK